MGHFPSLKSSINGPFSIATVNNQRLIFVTTNLGWSFKRPERWSGSHGRGRRGMTWKAGSYQVAFLNSLGMDKNDIVINQHKPGNIHRILGLYIYIYIRLVVEPSPLKNMSSSVGMMKFPIYGKINKFQTTNQNIWFSMGKHHLWIWITMVDWLLSGPLKKSPILGWTMLQPNMDLVSLYCSTRCIAHCGTNTTNWVCLKMLCTPKANGFHDHYPY